MEKHCPHRHPADEIFEPTTTVDMGIFLDVRTVSLPLWSVNPEKFELAIVTAASLANQALSEEYRVGLYINKNSPGTAENDTYPTQPPSGAAKAHSGSAGDDSTDRNHADCKNAGHRKQEPAVGQHDGGNYGFAQRIFVGYGSTK